MIDECWDGVLTEDGDEDSKVPEEKAARVVIARVEVEVIVDLVSVMSVVVKMVGLTVEETAAVVKMVKIVEVIETPEVLLVLGENEKVVTLGVVIVNEDVLDVADDVLEIKEVEATVVII